ncbi:MAG: hypothetical protein Q8M92_09390 [Candidatus Subteraquimicrobiales bacterium]|nr:hypothetical protein [Candidatus Subteraquimicrobiales bacterium]
MRNDLLETHLIVTIPLIDRRYRLFSICANANKELFIVFSKSRGLPFKEYNVQNMTERMIKSLDHFSYHKSGDVHLRKQDAKNKTRYFKMGSYETGPGDFPENEYTPLLIMSYTLDRYSKFILSGEFSAIKSLQDAFNSLFDDRIPDGVRIDLEENEKSDFSVIIYIIGKNVHPMFILNNENLKKLSPLKVVGVIYPFKKTDSPPDIYSDVKLLLITTRRILKMDGKNFDYIKNEKGRGKFGIESVFGVAGYIHGDKIDEVFA